MSVGTIIFPVRVEEQNFFQYLVQFLESFQVEVLIRVLLSSTKIEVVKVERISLAEQGLEPMTFRSEVARSTN